MDMLDMLKRYMNGNDSHEVLDHRQTLNTEDGNGNNIANGADTTTKDTFATTTNLPSGEEESPSNGNSEHSVCTLAVPPAQAKSRNSILRSFDPFYNSPILSKNAPVSAPLAEENEITTPIKENPPTCAESINNTQEIYATPRLKEETTEEALQQAGPSSPKPISNGLAAEISTMEDSLEDEKFFEGCEVADVEDEAVQKQTFKHDTPEKSPVEQSSEFTNELVELKEQLASVQREKSELESLVRQKDEVLSKQEQSLRDLREQLEKVDSIHRADEYNSEYTRSINLQKEKYEKQQQEFAKCIKSYEDIIAVKTEEMKTYKKENDLTKRHLANLELAFSDVLQKYESSKKIIEKYQTGEMALKQNLQMFEDELRKYDQKYNLFKAHVETQFNTFNKENCIARAHFDADICKLNSVNKRLEIKIESLNNALEQKKKECASLTALVEEMTAM